VKKKPDIIFITCHDLGKHIGCYGQETVNSPNIDRLAGEGIKFRNSFCTAPHCSPSRASIITGRYPHSNGVIGLSHGGFRSMLKPCERPVSIILKEQAGYETCLFGLQHATSNTDFLKFDRKFPPDTGYVNTIECSDVVNYFNEYIKNRKSNKPLYAEINFFEPHNPYDFGGTTADTEKGVKVPPYIADIPESRSRVAAFQGAIKKADWAIGKIIEIMEKCMDITNTWIIFTTDHGPALPFAKCTLYDPGIMTALIMKYDGKGINSGNAYDAMISNVDILPTILEGIGTATPDNVQGRSFWNLLKGKGYTKRQEIFAEKTYHETYDPVRAIRTKNNKLIINFENLTIGSNYWEGRNSIKIGMATDKRFNKSKDFLELYDLENDPLERTNLAGNREYKNIEDELTEKLYEWMKGTCDPLLEGPVPSATYTERIGILKMKYGK